MLNHRLKAYLLKLANFDKPDYGLAEYAEHSRQLASNPDPQRVVFIGDSIICGWYSATEFFRNLHLINRGIGWQTSAQMLVRFRQDVIELAPRSVVILGGINDILNGVAAVVIRNNIASMCDLARRHAIEPVICSILPARARPDCQSRIVEANTLLLAYAEEEAITYIDYYSCLVDSSGQLKEQATKDGIHLTKAGYELLEQYQSSTPLMATAYSPTPRGLV